MPNKFNGVIKEVDLKSLSEHRTVSDCIRRLITQIHTNSAQLDKQIYSIMLADNNSLINTPMQWKYKNIGDNFLNTSHN